MHDELGRRRLLKNVLSAARIPLALGGAFIGILVVGIGGAPGHMRSEHSVFIVASPEQISPYITSFRRWQEWSAWTPESALRVRNTYDGPETGVGSRWEWVDADGRDAHLEVFSVDPERILLGSRLNRFTPGEMFDISLNQDDAGTRLTLLHEGMAPGFVFWLQREGGEQFSAEIDSSLKKLKTVVEAAQ